MKKILISALCFFLYGVSFGQNGNSHVNVAYQFLNKKTMKPIDSVGVTLYQGSELIDYKSYYHANMIDSCFLLEKDKLYGLIARKNGFTDELVRINTYGLELGDTLKISFTLGRYSSNTDFKGNVLERKSFALLDSTKVKLLNLQTHEVDSIYSDDFGAFNFKIKPGYDYAVSAKKDFFLKRHAKINNCAAIPDNQALVCVNGFSDINFSEDDDNYLTSLDAILYMDKIDFESTYKIENVYYDLDKWNIRPDAAIELDKLVHVLNDNPEISIELGSHTDSRGKDGYNMSLSHKRAVSAVQYVVSKGISAKRISAQGYGETKLVNKCANGIVCSETLHQQNRRTEFRITDVKY